MNNVFDHTNGLQFFALGGNFLFARLAGGFDEQPGVDAGGNIYSSLASNELGVFDANGNLLRSAILGNLTAPNLGSDGTVYLGANLDILALNPDLSTKWRHVISRGAYFSGGPIVNSSNALVVVGVNDVGAPSFVQGIDAATGKLSWQVDLPAENGGFVRPMSRPRFSGVNRAYIGMDVNDSVPDPYTYLYAIDTTPGVTVASLTLNPTSVNAGTPSQGTVTLSGPAPPGGAVVKQLNSMIAVATVPRILTVLAGSNAATFTVTTKSVSANTKVTISASHAGVRKKATLTVTP